MHIWRASQSLMSHPSPFLPSSTQIPSLEVWFQRASDVVRKLRYGDIDLGIVGYDMFAELADADEDLIVVHDALDFGQCKLALGIPMTGKFAGINSLDALAKMPNWTAETPLRVVTGCVVPWLALREYHVVNLKCACQLPSAIHSTREVTCQYCHTQSLKVIPNFC